MSTPRAHPKSASMVGSVSELPKKPVHREGDKEPGCEHGLQIDRTAGEMPDRGCGGEQARRQAEARRRRRRPAGTCSRPWHAQSSRGAPPWRQAPADRKSLPTPVDGIFPGFEPSLWARFERECAGVEHLGRRCSVLRPRRPRQRPPRLPERPPAIGVACRSPGRPPRRRSRRPQRSTTHANASRPSRGAGRLRRRSRQHPAPDLTDRPTPPRGRPRRPAWRSRQRSRGQGCSARPPAHHRSGLPSAK